MIAIIAGALALRQAGRADDEAAAAEAAATRADARRVSAQALSRPSVDRALLLAVEGVRLDDSAETDANLLTVLTRQPVLPIANVPGRPAGTDRCRAPTGSCSPASRTGSSCSATPTPSAS